MKDTINELIKTVYYLVMAGSFVWILFSVLNFCVNTPLPGGIQWLIFGPAIYLVTIIWGEL